MEVARVAANVKDPTKVRAGTIGAARRWGDPANRRVVRLDSLLPEEQAVVRALLALRARRESRTPQEAA